MLLLSITITKYGPESLLEGVSFIVWRIRCYEASSETVLWANAYKGSFIYLSLNLNTSDTMLLLKTNK